MINEDISSTHSKQFQYKLNFLKQTIKSGNLLFYNYLNSTTLIDNFMS